MALACSSADRSWLVIRRTPSADRSVSLERRAALAPVSMPSDVALSGARLRRSSANWSSSESVSASMFVAEDGDERPQPCISGRAAVDVRTAIASRRLISRVNTIRDRRKYGLNSHQEISAWRPVGRQGRGSGDYNAWNNLGGVGDGVRNLRPSNSQVVGGVRLLAKRSANRRDFTGWAVPSSPGWTLRIRLGLGDILETV